MRIVVVDSHTEGEPTRVVLQGGPDLGAGSLTERRARFRAQHDSFRTAIVGEPRGAAALVGALLCSPNASGCAAGVIFFDNSGYLGMCGHGTIGLIVTLAHLGRIAAGVHRIDTPVGTISAELHADGSVTVANVPSYRWTASVSLEVPEHGRVTGHVAWGGNWFFIVDDPDIAPSLGDVEHLTDFAWSVRQALAPAGVTGAGGAEVDHVAIFGRATRPGSSSRNFVLCPGRAYDRSPCGTGTSAKLACLHAEGVLKPGEVWRQEGLVGGTFDARFDLDSEGRVLPYVTGRAHITAETTLVLDERDPFRWGIGACRSTS
jgi:4-hydroxyproline epimerase